MAKEPEFEDLPLEDLMSPAQLADALGVTVRRIQYAAQERGVGAAYRFGRQPVYDYWGQLEVLKDLCLPRLSSGPKVHASPYVRELRDRLERALKEYEQRDQAEHAALVAAGLREDDPDQGQAGRG